MSKRNKGNGVESETIPVDTSAEPATGDAATALTDAVAESSESGRVGGNGKARKVPDHSNRPAYYLFGRNIATGQVEVLAERPTLGQAQSSFPEILRVVGKFYDDSYVGRIKRVEVYGWTVV